MDNLTRGSILKDKIAGIASNALHSADKKLNDFINQTPTDFRPMRYKVIHKGGALVRAQEDVESAFVHQLKNGDTVTVTEIVGRRCRIISPVDGWVSLRTKTDDIQILKPVPFSGLVQTQQSAGSFENHFEKRFQELKGKQGTRATVTDDKLTRWVDDDRARSFDSHASDSSGEKRRHYRRKEERDRNRSRSSSGSSGRRRDEERRRDEKRKERQAGEEKHRNERRKSEKEVAVVKPVVSVTDTNLLWDDDCDSGFVSAPQRAPSAVSSSLPVLEAPRGPSMVSKASSIPFLPAPGTASYSAKSSTVIPAPSVPATQASVSPDILGGVNVTNSGTLLNLDETPAAASSLLDFDPFASPEKKKSVGAVDSGGDQWAADFSQFHSSASCPSTAAPPPIPSNPVTNQNFAPFPPSNPFDNVSNPFDDPSLGGNHMANPMMPMQQQQHNAGAMLQQQNTMNSMGSHMSRQSQQGSMMQQQPGAMGMPLNMGMPPASASPPMHGAPSSSGAPPMTLQQQQQQMHFQQQQQQGNQRSSVYALSQGATPTPMGMAALYANNAPPAAGGNMMYPQGNNMMPSQGAMPGGMGQQFPYAR